MPVGCVCDPVNPVSHWFNAFIERTPSTPVSENAVCFGPGAATIVPLYAADARANVIRLMPICHESEEV